MTAPIQLGLCREYLINATHRGNCPRCWADTKDAACTCGFDDLARLVASMEHGTKLVLSVGKPGLLVSTCDTPNCPLADVPHKHVKVDR